MSKILDYLDDRKLVVRHGQQAYYVRKALKVHDEVAFLTALATEYRDAGRVQTVAEGLVLAGATITTYKSNEAGERVPQKACAALDKEVAKKRAAEATRQTELAKQKAAAVQRQQEEEKEMAALVRAKLKGA